MKKEFFEKYTNKELAFIHSTLSENYKSIITLLIENKSIADASELTKLDYPIIDFVNTDNTNSNRMSRIDRCKRLIEQIMITRFLEEYK